MTRKIDGIDDLFEVLKFVDVFLPNEREAKKITRADNVDAAVAALAQHVPVVAVKLGAEGAMACGPSGSVRCAARAVEAIDPVGAGDSFDAGFIHAYVRGADLGGMPGAGQRCRRIFHHASRRHRGFSRQKVRCAVFSPAGNEGEPPRLIFTMF